ncbi:hypothetical protein C4K40_2387 [Pseudomonas sp. CMR5c]|nr:hypothetical protein C4K40_2387 [Pseudomonas sp. CMR5c]
MNDIQRKQWSNQKLQRQHALKRATAAWGDPASGRGDSGKCTDSDGQDQKPKQEQRHLGHRTS